jgi:hypothetical protein
MTICCIAADKAGSGIDIGALLTIVSALAGVVVAIVALITGVQASKKASNLASEQEQLRRTMRTDALYSLMALYDLLGELSTYIWMTGKEKRVDKEFITSFLASRIDELSKIHSNPAYFLWKRATSNFMPQAPISEEPLAQILGQDLATKDLARRLATMPEGIGEAIVTLESNHWISSIDALYRLKSSQPLNISDKNDAPPIYLLDKYGVDALNIIRILLAYFDQTRILGQLLTYYEPKLAAHIDEFARATGE